MPDVNATSEVQKLSDQVRQATDGFAALAASIGAASRAWETFHDTLRRDHDRCVAAMTDKQRGIYNDLIARGVPWLDAACWAIELAPRPAVR